jgi:LemA protein
MTDDNQPTQTLIPMQFRKILVFIGVILAVMIVVATIAGSYNTLVDKDMTVSQMRGNLQNSLERRADLIPNIVATIQGSGKFEQSTLVDVIAMRSQSQQIRENIAGAQTTAQLQTQETSLAGVIGRLMLVYEQYPVLKTTDQYKELSAQLVATENQINGNRDNYNAAVRDYQQTVRSFPTNVMAGMFGFHADKWVMFSTPDAKQDVPVVGF